MKVLLDTHTFLWAIADPEKLSSAARNIIASSDRLWSAASIWETLIKVQLRKLPLPSPAGGYLIQQLTASGVKVLPIKLEHALRVESLDNHHRDPFDRMLIAQALEESLPIVTADLVFSRYPVEVVW